MALRSTSGSGRPRAGGVLGPGGLTAGDAEPPPRPQGGVPLRGPHELRLARRPLLLFAIVLPLLVALAGFGMQQSGVPEWPAPPVASPERGRILAIDGTILAEGPVAERHYPQQSLAAHVVGFSGREQPDGRFGLEGIELTRDAALQAGADVRLTVDPILQAAAERHLEASVVEHGAHGGSVVMLEAKTGRILASASYPTFDPNRQSEFPRSALGNRAFQRPYEPGSVMKPFVVAALLQNDRLAPDELVPAPPTKRVGNKTFQDVVSHPDELPVRDVLRYSSNTAMLSLTERLQPSELHAWLRGYGFGRPLSLGSAYTRPGLLNAWQDWVPQDQASITIGQGVSTTPLHLAAAYGIFANDGLYVPPRLVEGEEVPPPQRVLSSEVARTVRDMLVYTVEESGLRNSRIPGVRVAGKTGTADIYSAEQGTYPRGWYSLTFAGMFPAEDPRVVMVVMLERPRSEATSTYVAAPLFRAIGSEIVAHWGIAPGPAQRADAR